MSSGKTSFNNVNLSQIKDFIQLDEKLEKPILQTLSDASLTPE